MYLVTPSQTPKPVSCGWGNTWDKPSTPSSRPERAGKQGRRERPLPGRRTCLPKSGVLKLEGCWLLPGRGCAGLGPQGPEGGSLPLPAPPRREGAAALGREGTRVYKQGGGSAGGKSTQRGGGVQRAWSLVRISASCTLTPPAVAHRAQSSVPRLRLRGLLFSGCRRRRRRCRIQPGPSPPPPGRDPTMHFFSHPHRPTLPCGMPLGEEGRASSPRHDSRLSVGVPKRYQRSPRVD